jgi:hypothetical protein
MSGGSGGARASMMILPGYAAGAAARAPNAPPPSTRIAHASCLLVGCRRDADGRRDASTVNRRDASTVPPSIVSQMRCAILREMHGAFDISPCFRRAPERTSKRHENTSTATTARRLTVDSGSSFRAVAPGSHIPVLAQKGPTRTEEVFSHSEFRAKMRKISFFTELKSHMHSSNTTSAVRSH